jgi:flagellar biogenesis protein FliO
MSTNTPGSGPHSGIWQGGPRSALRGPWATVASVAGLAIVAGLMLPKLLSSETVIDKDRPRTDSKGGVAVSEYKAPNLPEVPNPQALLGRLFMGTIVVLGLSVLSIWVMRRWLPGQVPAHAAPRDMRLIETLHLGNRSSLHLVHLGQREILVGVDAGGIKSIVPLSKPFDDALAETVQNDAAADMEPASKLTA